MPDPVTDTRAVRDVGRVLAPARAATSARAGGRRKAREPWALTAVWAGTGAIEGYATWVAANHARFDRVKYLCNWYPLTLLVAYAASRGLRLRLFFHPGSSPTTGGERRVDASQTGMHDSHDGSYAGRGAFLRKVRSTVRAQMIGELNTERVSREEVRVGDLLVRVGDERYWHVEVVTEIAPDHVATLSGYTPARLPLRKTYTVLPDNAYGRGFRRWRFAQFDDSEAPG